MTLTVTAGTPATAAQYNALIPLITEQTGDQALTTTPAAWNVTIPAFAAGGTWWCEIFLDYGNFSTATNNVQVVWGAPTGTATQSRIFVMGNAAASGSVTDANATIASRVQNTTTSYSGTTSTSIRGLIRQAFKVTGGASGGSISFTLAMSAGTGTVYAGSTLICHQLA